jgi:hypothetical protein
MKTPRLLPHLVTATWMAAGAQAQADAFHSTEATLGAPAAYAKSLSSALMLRADLASLPGIGRESIDEGVSYTGHIKSDRGALFMDWHFAGSLRLTGGMTFKRTRVDLRAGGNGGVSMAGEVPYMTAANDRLDVAIRSPNTMPYLGVGYGQYGATGSSVQFDIGGSIGRTSLGETPGGPQLGIASQALLDQELAQLRDGVGRVRFMPQVSLGMNLKF